MYVLAWIPYIKWIVLLLLIILYYFLHETKKHKWLIGLHAVVFLLVAGPAFYYKFLDVHGLKGVYTSVVVDLLFLLLYFTVCIILFISKIKLYKKIIVGLSLVVFCYCFFIEFAFADFWGWKNIVEKTYVINDKFTLLKEFSDFGRPYPYVIEESKYSLFVKRRTTMMQISADDEVDSVKITSVSKKILKLKVFTKDTTYNAFFLLGYDWNRKVNKGYIKVSKNNKEGFVDTKLNVVVPLEYNALGDIDETYECIGYKNNQKGIINLINKTFTPTK